MGREGGGREEKEGQGGGREGQKKGGIEEDDRAF